MNNLILLEIKMETEQSQDREDYVGEYSAIQDGYRPDFIGGLFKIDYSAAEFIQVVQSTSIFQYYAFIFEQ